ncbi:MULTISPECIES: hypothetical protein [Sporosarcina]|uniref:hypothetical protein n=1 Tax=Sporosarcina TaxID=1569 RepID=UPI000C1697B4|nr:MULTISPECIES: hypothetical protein [Sporosarcina]PIC58085.1 hypothetical protein CSV81_04970 [Sporosarcina sp. P10]PIC61587.1 hypothetical protein CSV80_04050 [Sporosarcina sp. P12(2017)]PIC76883.1 hypothetical protein CSV74_08185 [Sporosarcina sp. P19]
MKLKWIMGLAITASAAAALYFIIKLNLEFAILFMLIMFTFTNAARTIMYRNQGLMREAKWMLWMALFFGVGSLGALAYILLF